MGKIMEKLKENKKVMLIKMEEANKIADAAAQEFIDSIRPLVKDASEEDLQAFMKEHDDDIEFMDKMAVVTAFAESRNDIDGVIMIGTKRQ